VLRRAALAPTLLAVVLATTGWLYLVRVGPGAGPSIREALPLDELAKVDAVPLWEFAAVWLAAAALIGLAARWARVERLTAAIVLGLSTWALLYAADGSSIAVTRQIPARQAFEIASRFQSVTLSAVLVGLMAALLAGARPRGRRAPVIVASLVAAAGALDLLHAMLPGESQGLVRNLTPDAIGPLAHAAGAFAGLALLFAARGLARGRQRAWQIAVSVAALSFALHVAHGLTHGTVLSATVLVLLIARRGDFVLPGDVRTRFPIARRAIVAIAAIAAYGVAAVWLNRLAADQPFTLRFAARETVTGLLGLDAAGSRHLAGSFGEWFPISLLLVGLGATAWVVGGWLAPWRQRIRQEAEDRTRARELIRRHGDDTLAPFALREDKAYFFSEGCDAFLGYRVVGGVAIVSGDPIGRREAFADLVGRFVDHAHERDWRVAILGASDRFLPLYRAHGLHALYHGDEAVVETAAFSLEGRAIRKVRQSAHRLGNAGYRALVLPADEIDDDQRRELESIAEAWRDGQPERGFAMAFDALFPDQSPDAIFVIGVDRDGRPQGFLHFALAPAISALSLSSMPRLRSSTPNGFNEWLICETVRWAREQGIERVSLNFSPFAALLAPDAELSAFESLQRQALLRLKGHFQLDNLLAFNRKFFPSWQSRFLVYERRRDLPRVGIAALAAESYLPFQNAR
jgi:lysyl-tRNA synthetase class 2